MVQTGGSRTAAAPGYTGSTAERYQNASSALVLYTGDLEQTAQMLRERGLQFRGDDGPGCLTFTDLDRHWFQLVNPEHS